DGVERISSDDFTRQHEVGALFDGSVCVGMSCFRWVDLSTRFARNDSYFSAWSDEIIEKLTANGTRVCIVSQISMPKRFRGGRNAHSLKSQLLAHAVGRFLYSSADVMIGILRNDRNMISLAYQFGAKPLSVDAKLHRVHVDLVAFY